MRKLLAVLLCIGIVGCYKFTGFEPVGIEPDPHEWAPLFRFDVDAADHCYPDTPDPANDSTCITTFNRLAPVYYEGQWCSSRYYKLAYWVWYGRQQPCFAGKGGHYNDWEHVILNFDYKSANEFVLESVTYYQHSGWYTRRIEATSPRPDDVSVWVGKIGHGNYHNWCDNEGLPSEADYCPGGCLYWDDFRNDKNGIQWKPTNLIPLDEARKIKGEIGERVKREKNYCDMAACCGIRQRSTFLWLTELFSSMGMIEKAAFGCWQNDYLLWPGSHRTNDYDAPVFCECSEAPLFASKKNSRAISSIYSIHNDEREDRIWKWRCANLPGGASTCEWTDSLNGWDAPIEYTAPHNYFISGVASYHDNYYEDRIWSVKICKQEGRCCSGCEWTGYVNDWDGELNLQTNGRVICGIRSLHDDHYEDRRWEFLLCDLVNCQ